MMRQSASTSSGDLSRELEEERRARGLALSELENQRRVAEATDRLSSAALSSRGVDDLLERVLAIFADVARADVALVRLREGDRLRARAAVGLGEQLAASSSLSVGDALPGEPPEGESSREQRLPSLFRADPDGPCGGELIRELGVRALYGVPLRHQDELVGVVYLGRREPGELPDAEQQLVRLLAARTAAAIVRANEFEVLARGIRSREDVLGIVAHDLRNPINIISLAANSLLRRLPTSSARRPVERIVRGAQRANRLIQGLLEIDAIEGRRFVINTSKVEVADTILAALESQQGLAADASIIISADVSPDLPPIEAEEERILEVLENLVGNAIKFTSPGGSVTVGAGVRGREILFWVKDTGSGIRSEDLPHLFDRFWQARKRDRRGTGLGLTICKAIVEAHGGRIWPETKVGEGTKMCFTIPAMARTRKPAKVEVANVLMVDDRPENLLALKAVLERPDYRLVTATSGEEALRLALRETFEVVLLDIAMPVMNGLEVAVHLKELERSRDIPIIFITAFGDDPEEIHRAYAAGGADYLVKPLDAEIVRKKVAVFVDLSRRRQAGQQSGDRSETDASSEV